jgi:hypothetical protein
MLKINERTIEAVAALLYNTIYDLSHPSEGAWCPEERYEDPAYLAFAESLLRTVHDDLDASGHAIIQAAERLTNREKAGSGWQVIVIDQEYFSLPEQAEKVIDEVRAFIADPNIADLECDFLDLDRDVV